MKIYLAAFNGIAESILESAMQSFVSKFTDCSIDDFVHDDPDVIWFLSGGSEHNALKHIESQNRYCLIASVRDNSWAAATEVKALLNEKGINTRIFDYDKLDSLSELQNYLNVKVGATNTKLGLIGNSADWLVASIPEEELLSEVLNIEIVNYSHEDVLQMEISKGESSFDSVFKNCSFETKQETSVFATKLQEFVKKNKLDAVAIDCFGMIKDVSYTPCLPVAALNETLIPTACEGDLCSVAGMIVLQRLTGKIPWMANLMHITRDYAEFSHCTAAPSLLEDYEIDTHFETDKGSAVKGKLRKQQVTVFRIDRKLEFCFLSLGEVLETENSANACRTQAKIQLSQKSLFLLKEFPLGNHHLIVPGDYTDILAEYFTCAGFRIV